MLNVAIIDDGINSDEVKVDYSFKIDSDLNVVDISSVNEITYESHGTTCLKIIKKYLNKDTNGKEIIFHSIKVINLETVGGNVNQFVKALEFCLSLNIKVINLSIGSSYFMDFDRIEKAVRKLVDSGVIIIAALNNKWIITYPACLPCVIGVKTDSKLKDDEYICNGVLDVDNIEITASSAHILRNTEGIYKSKTSNSYATPLITSKVINYLLLESELSLEEIKIKLRTDKNNNDNICMIIDIEIPIVLFNNFPQEVLQSLLITLKEKFCANGYNCEITTQIDVKLIKFMNYDIVLLYTSLNDSNLLNDISLIINYDSGIDNFNIINNDIYYELTVNDTSSDKIYESILKILL